MTTWKPDTCDCELEYDDDIKLIRVIKKCKLHNSIVDNADFFTAVISHNKTFNILTPEERQAEKERSRKV